MRYEKRPLGTVLTAVAVLLIATASGARAEISAIESPVTGIDDHAIFEQLKSLLGEWQGQWEPGSVPTTVTYSLTGNGSVLVEDYLVGETTMATLYHLDGDDLMLTHYCSAGNQPRMRLSTVSEDQGQVTFDLMDITNNTTGGYSKRLVVSMLGEDRISLTYTSSRTGKPSGVELERVR